MFQLEERFENQMIDFGDQEPVLRHYMVAEVLAGQPVWHLVGVLPIEEPDGHIYRKRIHYVTTKAGLAAGILESNPVEDVSIFIVMPPVLTASMQPEITRCKALWECWQQDDPEDKGWGCDTESGSFVDPLDGFQTEDVIRGKILWQAT